MNRIQRHHAAQQMQEDVRSLREQAAEAAVQRSRAEHPAGSRRQSEGEQAETGAA